MKRLVVAAMLASFAGFTGMATGPPRPERMDSKSSIITASVQQGTNARLA
jgi:hypothetical protein